MDETKFKKTGGLHSGRRSQAPTSYLIYKSNSGVCLFVWAVPGRFFQSLPVPCGASPDVMTSEKKEIRGNLIF